MGYIYSHGVTYNYLRASMLHAMFARAEGPAFLNDADPWRKFPAVVERCPGTKLTTWKASGQQSWFYLQCIMGYFSV